MHNTYQIQNYNSVVQVVHTHASWTVWPHIFYIKYNFYVCSLYVDLHKLIMYGGDYVCPLSLHVLQLEYCWMDYGDI
jgi:hypothetical protein